MRIASIRQAIFPSPRKTIPLWAAWKPLAWMMAFGLLCWVLDRTDTLIFTNPQALWLVMLMPWFWWLSAAGHSGLTGWRGAIALGVRWVVLSLLILILAQPRSVRKDQTLSVIFAVDYSASISPSMREEALTFAVNMANEKPEKDQAGLVFFGRDAAVELPPMPSFPFEAVNVQVNADGTNIEQGLSLSSALIADDKIGRIVLITDGTATEGNLPPLLDELKARDIPVDVLPIAYDHDQEVWVERLELPRFVRIGENYEAAVIVSSLSAGKGDLIFKENGRVIYRGEAAYQSGKNRFVLPLQLREPGYYEYEAAIEVPKENDGYQRNNKAISYLFLQGQNQTLLVMDSEGDRRDWETLKRTLELAKRDVQVMSAYELPTDPLALLMYDSILFVNVPAEQLSVPQFEALRDAVYHQGSGFLMVGGDNSFGPGGYHNTLIEELLPVTMDIKNKKILPKSAMAIILHTCEFPQGNTWGKRITKQAIKVLGSQDEIGVLVYGYQGGAQWLFPFTPASQYKQLSIKINKVQIGDMPSFANTMTMALTGFKNVDAANKHMIIISDGDPQPPPPALLQQFVNNRISVTTVAVFPHGTQTQTMRAIANVTGGRFYFPQNANKLPSIFIKEAKTLRRSMIQNKTFTPAVQFPSPILKGIDSMPPLDGYVLTTPKGRSTTVLEGPETREPDPILATWRYGIGKTAVFTSDLSSNWAKNWMTWPQYHAFSTQLVKDISRLSTPSQVHMQAFAAGNRGVITAQDVRTQGDMLTIDTQIRGPDGQTRTITLEQIASHRYEARFDLWSEGRYQIIGQTRGEKDLAPNAPTQRMHAGFAVPYSQEYLRFGASPLTLRQIVTKTGGRLLTHKTTSEDIFTQDRQAKKTSKPAFDWLLILLCCILPLDIAVRRIHIDLQYLREIFGTNRTITPSEKTFDTLLRKKKDVQSQLASSMSKRRESQMDFVEDIFPTPPDSETKPTTRIKPTDKTDTNTTSRLLARKRQRDQENK